LLLDVQFIQIPYIYILSTMSSNASLPTRRLGKGGPQVTAFGIGLMGRSAFYGATESGEERMKILDHVHASGQRFWNSADVYGDNEDLIGKRVFHVPASF
jgi:hypothetical protein